MSHAPWTKEQVEKWSEEFCKSGDAPGCCACLSDCKQVFIAAIKKAEEIIEASQTVYFEMISETSFIKMGTHKRVQQTHKGKLVGVKPIWRGDRP